MPYITATDRALYYAAVHNSETLESGILPVGDLVVSWCNLPSAADENEFLGMMVGNAGGYKPLPAQGEWLEAGDIYGYAGGLVIVRQSHVRTEHAPEDVPALFSVYRENAADTLDWIANERIEMGMRRIYDGVLYQCIQAHVTQADWMPPAVPALWMAVVSAGAEWTPGAVYAVGDEVTYRGKTYRCLQAHTAYPNWTPDTTPALWQVVAEENEWPEWVRPTGAHDAYNIGDKVTFQGGRYVSMINGNVWSPVEYPAGWEYQGPAE